MALNQAANPWKLIFRSVPSVAACFRKCIGNKSTVFQHPKQRQSICWPKLNKTQPLVDKVPYQRSPLQTVSLGQAHAY